MKIENIENELKKYNIIKYDYDFIDNDNILITFSNELLNGPFV